MVREFTELQGTMGGIYAREEGLPEEVWKAIYFQYMPVGVETDAPPSRAQLGKAGSTWAALALADRLDTLVGLFAAGEKPTGSRDPFGLRRAAQGVVKILSDLPATTGMAVSISVDDLVAWAFEGYASTLPSDGDWRGLVFDFFGERQLHLLERRGYRYDEIRAVMSTAATPLRPRDVLRRVEALSQARERDGFEALAVLFKRVKNITRDFVPGEHAPSGLVALKGVLTEPAEQALLDNLPTAPSPAITSSMR
jgi:glycyl-tRNA synthetase beta chain